MNWDDDEFAMVFDDIYPGLCRFLEGMLGRHDAAQDIAQESFLRLHRFGPDGLPPGEARFWLYRVARNLALNELSHGQTRRRLVSLVADLFRPAARDPEAELSSREEGARMRELLASLPEHQRAALLLREQDGMSYSEIARVLGVSESKVKVDIFRARSAARGMWAAERERPPRRAAIKEVR